MSNISIIKSHLAKDETLLKTLSYSLMGLNSSDQSLLQAQQDLTLSLQKLCPNGEQVDDPLQTLLSQTIEIQKQLNDSYKLYIKKIDEGINISIGSQRECIKSVKEGLSEYEKKIQILQKAEISKKGAKEQAKIGKIENEIIEAKKEKEISADELDSRCLVYFGEKNAELKVNAFIRQCFNI